MSNETSRKRGRPKKTPTQLMTLRISDALLLAVDAFADRHGMSRNKAGLRLIEQAMHTETTKLLTISSAQPHGTVAE